MNNPTIPASFLLPCLSIFIAACLVTGCEDHSTGTYFNTGSTPHADTEKDPTELPPGVGELTGSWGLKANDGSVWYVHFKEDGTWKITDDAEGQAHRVHGSYTTKGNSFSGDMVNPRVGTGEINGAWKGPTITLNFIEHWHTPYKVIPYTGSRL